MKAIGTLIIIGVLVGGSYFGYAKFIADQQEPGFVLAPLDRGDIIQTVSATGTIEPITKVIVGSQVSGRISRWHADFNDRVTEGFVLAELDQDRFKTALNQATAELALARAREEEALVRFKDAQREADRIQKLSETNTASKNEFLVAQAAAEAAQAVWHGTQASVEAAQAQLNAASVDLDRTIIRSPIDGVVISRTIDVGQTVAASLQAPELFLIANKLEQMQVNANVAESDVGLIEEGKHAHFRVDAYPDRDFTGTISQIRYNATIVDAVVTYVTLIEAENDDLALRPGMTANVTFEVAKAEKAVRIPNSALRFSPIPPDASGRGGKSSRMAPSPTVWILDAKGEPQAVQVETGLSDGTYTELVGSALAEGDKVITERNWRGGRGGGRSDPSRTMR